MTEININKDSCFRIGQSRLIYFLSAILFTIGCSTMNGKISQNPDSEKDGTDYIIPDIDLSHWKVTLPIGNPSEVKPPEILDYANNELLQKYMYNDSLDGSLVFYTYPG
ncbi:MAG: polysaccharide lyase family 7 protein, partial [Bacteroidia bacterium]|nr:polysaccharide lyase family 7 protein [Bacteroidia bacterium]